MHEFISHRYRPWLHFLSKLRSTKRYIWLTSLASCLVQTKPWRGTVEFQAAKQSPPSLLHFTSSSLIKEENGSALPPTTLPWYKDLIQAQTSFHLPCNIEAVEQRGLDLSFLKKKKKGQATAVHIPILWVCYRGFVAVIDEQVGIPCISKMTCNLICFTSSPVTSWEHRICALFLQQ